MTMPHLMNCPHSGDGWCLDCVKEQQDELEQLKSALESQRRWWHQIPSGIDLEADPEDTSPEDSSAHIAGLAVQEIDTFLKVGS